MGIQATYIKQTVFFVLGDSPNILSKFNPFIQTYIKSDNRHIFYVLFYNSLIDTSLSSQL